MNTNVWVCPKHGIKHRFEGKDKVDIECEGKTITLIQYGPKDSDWIEEGNKSPTPSASASSDQPEDEEVEGFPCPLCGRVLETKSGFKSHVKACDGSPFEGGDDE